MEIDLLKGVMVRSLPEVACCMMVLLYPSEIQPLL
jgi:hypothetical protein